MQGLLVVISGFSGVGKGTLVKALLERYPEEFALSISATSRSPREGEVDGREYFFKTRDEFESMIHEDALLEHAQYNGNYYGTPRDFVTQMLESGKNVILEIEIAGALQVRKTYPETYLMYVVPPNARTLYERLKGRGTETHEVIIQRLKKAVEEASFVSSYDYITVNDDFEVCLKDIYETIKARQEKIQNINDYEESIKQDLTDLIKGEENAASVL